ncbi:hypothetical protein [Macrococcoides canis]|uniref:hypothetical protein n=1 Tax=Macrococcoides canis TaxID=1855823 RepID=UPI00207D042A|nr:hypothetical protein [Macrococcus canis]MCO4097752.1 hypothetical protein [Macrococcus canis]UTH06715.1 hypothetical protein KFV07_11365 [Macrococcus canis]UTH09066.1 hypothetical protein KFV08_11395 [Macrococcus canis]
MKLFTANRFYLAKRRIEFRDEDDNLRFIAYINADLFKPCFIHIEDCENQNRICRLRQKMLELTFTMECKPRDSDEVTIRRSMRTMRPIYDIPELDWNVDSNPKNLRYTVYDDSDDTIAVFSVKKFGASLEIEYDEYISQYEYILGLSVMIQMDIENGSAYTVL